MLKVSLLGVGTVLRLARDTRSVVIRLRQATNEYAPPAPDPFFEGTTSHCRLDFRRDYVRYMAKCGSCFDLGLVVCLSSATKARVCESKVVVANPFDTP